MKAVFPYSGSAAFFFALECNKSCTYAGIFYDSMKKSIVILFVILASVSCKRKDPVDPPPPTVAEGMLTKVWSMPLVDQAPPGGLSMSGFIFEGHVYFNNEYTFELKGYPLDGTGPIRSLAKGEFYMWPGKRNYHLEGSQLFIRSLSKKIQRLDMHSGQLTDLHTGSQRMGARMSFYKDKIYFVEHYSEGTSILGLDIQSAVIDTIFNYKLAPEWQAGFEPPIGLELNGRDFLAFQLRQAGPHATASQSYYMYDIEGDSLLWSQVDIDSLEGGVGEPFVDDKNIYWMGSTHVFCFDLGVGNLKWKHTNSDQKGHYHGFIFRHNDKIIVKSDGDNITALDPNTGKIRWINYGSGSTPTDTYALIDNAVCYYSQGKGYFASIDMKNSGRSIIYEMSPVKNYDNSPTMGTSVVIDQATRRLYYANFSDVVCLQIAPFN